MKIRKDDKVVVLSGRDKGKEGKVLSADPQAGRRGRHHPARDPHLRQQGHAGLPEVRQAHPRGSHRYRRRKGARLQEVRRRYLREESDRILWLTLQD